MRTKLRHLTLGLLTLASLQLGAHEGHGQPGAAHWHGSDAPAFIAGAVAVGLVIWLARRK
jgi:hypothetical protein